MNTTINKTKTAKQIFQNAVKGENFCTPEILYFEHIKNGVIEFSRGKIMGSLNYGVTVVMSDKINFDLSKNFNNKKQALNYIESLR
tara:strand:- start:996 stop:1253 length:258 start_codon:yes stop_codon:yes gene_type:complete